MSIGGDQISRLEAIGSPSLEPSVDGLIDVRAMPVGASNPTP